MRNVSCMFSSVMKVLISVLFSGLLTERALNRAMGISLARVGLVCRGIVIRLLKITEEGFLRSVWNPDWRTQGVTSSTGCPFFKLLLPRRERLRGKQKLMSGFLRREVGSGIKRAGEIANRIQKSMNEYSSCMM